MLAARARPTALTPSILAMALLVMALAACAPEVGSDRWCAAMEARDKGEWTANDAAAYAKHCMLGLKPER